MAVRMSKEARLRDVVPVAVSLAVLGALLLGVGTRAEARITTVTITTTESAFGSYSWPGVGQYEKIVGKACGAIDPADPHNAVITDIGLAPTVKGAVTYCFDFYILKPVDLSKGAHKVMYEPPNRGSKTWANFGRVTDPTTNANDPGSITNPTILANAFLMPRGYTMVWSGWDKAAGTNSANFNTTITLPVAVNPDGSTITGPAYEYIVVTSAVTSFALSYPANSLDTTQATLTHRVHLDDTPTPIASDGWAYFNGGTTISLVDSSGTPVAFVPNDIYELSYTAKSPTVNGVGFAAVRDWNSWLRYEMTDDSGTPNPLAGDITRIYTEVVSQPGRFLNDFTHLGFNQDENGNKVFDGMMQWIAAGDGINMNYRWSQPGRTERNRQEHLYAEGVFPFSNVTTTDPATGKTDSRYTRCAATHPNTCPLAVEIYSANEYWVKAASLLHTNPEGTIDLPDSPYARNYFISSHQHGTGSATSKGVCQQFQNPLNSGPIQRALFIALDEWTTGTLPPPSRVPTFRDHTLVSPLPQSAVGFPHIPGVTYTGLKTTRYLLNYGPDYYTDGIPTINPPMIALPYENNSANGHIYPSFVPKTDSDGNDIPGVRLGDVSVPLATYTGWALRSGPQSPDGCEGAGQYIPFATTKAERIAAQDPRPSVQERYPFFLVYEGEVILALDALVWDRLLLCEDASTELTRLLQAGLAAGVPAPLVSLPTPTNVPLCH